MNTEHSSRFLNRSSILKLLSNEELAGVSRAESGPPLSVGEEYLDLGALDQGVRRADGEPIAMRRVLPKKAVREATWAAILAQLEIMAM